MNKVKLADICKILNGYAFKSANYISKGIRIIRITNVQNGYIEDNSPAFYPIERKSEIENYLLKKDDLLLSLTGNVGRVALLPEEMLPAALNQRVACLRLNDEKVCDKKFLYYCLNNNSFERKCICSSKGIAQKNLSTEWLKSYKIELPEINIQKKIVDTLDKLNKLIFYRNTQLRLLDDLVKSRFTELFGDPLNPIKSKYLGDIALLERGKFSPRPRNDPRYYNGKYPFVQTGDIANSNHKLKTYHQTLNEKGIKVSKQFQEGTVLIALVGATIGATTILEIPMYAPDSIIGIIVNKKSYNNIFLELVLQFWKSKLKQMAPESARANINLNILRKLPIIDVDINKQNKYVDFVQKIDKSKVEIQKSLDKLEMLKKSLMQQYFG